MNIPDAKQKRFEGLSSQFFVGSCANFCKKETRVSRKNIKLNFKRKQRKREEEF